MTGVQTCALPILAFAENYPGEIRDDMIDTLSEYGFNVNMKMIEFFAISDMEIHLEKYLRKLELVQNDYLKLWKPNKKCRHIVECYFNDEGKDMLGKKYMQKKKKYLIETICNLSLLIFASCCVLALFMAGVVLVSTNYVNGSNDLFIMGIMFIAISSISVILFIIIYLLVGFSIHNKAKKLKAYSQALKINSDVIEY